MLQKVSVIVPIYNVEKYLNKCIDSILNQSYKNLEVILVNDGSTDKCGLICEEYSKKDKRIKVIHKTNGGLSDARNFGMKKVTGEFTLFVDSDDWLELNMIEVLINEINIYKAEIVQSSFYYAYEDYLLYDDRYYLENDKPIILNNEQLMKELIINEKVKNFAWGKLYKTELIKNIPFEKGVLFEDVFWAHQVMHKVNKYVIVHKPLCYYLQRSNSIVATYTIRNLDIIRGLKERHKFIQENYYNLLNQSYKSLIKANITQYNLLMFNRREDKNSIYRKEIKNYIRSNYKVLMNCVKDDKKLKQQLRLFNIYPPLNLLIIIKNKILRELKIIKQPLKLRKIDL